MRLDATLSAMARRIKKNEKERRVIAERLREMKAIPFKEIDVSREVMHETLVSPMEKRVLDCRVGGVDGGVLSSRYHTIDLMVMRAVAPVFTYEKELAEVAYFPEKAPSVFVHTNVEGSDIDFLLEKNIRRQTMELETALQAVEEGEPDFMLLHGPLAPYPTDKPRSSSKVSGLYGRMVSAFLSLYKACEKRETRLAGIVEDSRGARFSSILKEALPSQEEELSRMRDTALLYDVLEHGERTFPFKYTVDPLHHPVISDLGEWGQKLYSFYAKTAPLDRPLRVDFISFTDDVTEEVKNLSSLIFTLSSFSRVYGIPTVITEADHRAKLRAEDINLIYDLLREKVGRAPSLLKLRREARPFG